MTVDITPTGMLTPEGRVRVAEAEAKVVAALGACADYLAEMVADPGPDWGMFSEHARRKTLVQRRQDATEELLLALCDRPNVAAQAAGD